MLIQSKFIDFINNLINFFKNKFGCLLLDSFFVKNLDWLIFAFIIFLFGGSLFLQTEQIGLIALCVVILTFISLFVKKSSNVVLTRWDAILTIFIFICVISAVNSLMFATSFKGLMKYLTYFVTYLSFFQYFRFNKSKIMPLIAVLLFFSTIEALIAIFQNHLGFSQISTWQDISYLNPEDVLDRAYGTLKPYNPNLLSGFLLAIFPLFFIYIYEFFKEKSYFMLALTTLSVFWNLSAIFYTGSRSAYLGLLGLFILIFIGFIKLIKRNVKYKKFFNWIFASILALVFLVIALTPSILKRFMSIFVLRQDSSTSFRLNVYNSSWQMFCDNCFLGIGLGNETFREIYGLYMISGFDALSSYCVPLEILVETGIIGFILYLIFFATLIFYGIKFILNNKDISQNILISSILGSIFALSIQSLFDTVIFRPQVQFVFWAEIAIMASIITSKKEF